LIELQVSKRLIGSKGPFDLSVRLSVRANKLAVLYGASGAGKTTLLRMLAGLDRPDDGCIEVDGETWFDSRQKVCVPPQKRSVGFVFQNYALFPSMTVRRNLEFAAGRRKDSRVDMLLEMVELQELHNRYPANLSGGQQQSVLWPASQSGPCFRRSDLSWLLRKPRMPELSRSKGVCTRPRQPK